MPGRTLSLEKGHRLSLDKGLDEIILGLGWTPNVSLNPMIDPDASAFALRTDGQVRNDSWVIYYNQKSSPDGDRKNPPSIRSAGDDRGEGDELAELAGTTDSEQIVVQLSRVPLFVTRIVFVVTIHKAAQRRHHFGQLNDCYIRVLDTENNEELGRYNLRDDFDDCDAVIFGELVRERNDPSNEDDSGSWHFEAVGEKQQVPLGSEPGLDGFFAQYGV